MKKVLWIREQYLIPRRKRSRQRTFLLSCVICFQTTRNVRLFPGFGDATVKKSWPLTHPSITILWLFLIYWKPCLKPSFLRPAGVKSLRERSFPTLPSLQSQASAKPRNRLDRVSRELTSQDKAFPDWISLTKHLRPENRSVKNSAPEARKVRLPTDHLTSKKRKRALRKSSEESA